MKKNEKNLNFFYVPCRDRPEAVAIGRTLLAERLAACANITDGMTSIYPWNGSIQEDHEAVLVVKTLESKKDECVARLKELHSYEVPCIIAWNAEVLNADYFSFIENATL